MKRAVGFLAAVASVAVLLPATAQAAPAGEIHYPDLQTLVPSDLTIEQTGAAKLLRFSNIVANFGDGPFELRPANDAGTQTTVAYQRLLTHGSGKKAKWSLVSEAPIGTFVFHPTHIHWHFEHFASYKLHAVALDGGIGELVRDGSKVTFCLADTNYFGGPEHSSRRRSYPISQCGRDTMQGLSVGWGDMYPWYLDGQFVDIAGVADGTYWLVSTADPDNLVAETNDANNVGSIKIAISGNSVSPAP